jgi:competence protein ComEC
MPWITALGLAFVVGVASTAWSQPDAALIASIAVALAAWAVLARSLSWLVPAAALAGSLSTLALPSGPVLTGIHAVQGVVVGAASGRSVDVSVSRLARLGGPWQSSRGRIRVRMRERPPPPGTHILLWGQARHPREPLPGAPDPVRSARLGRIRTFLSVAEWTRLGGAHRPRSTSADPLGVLGAIATGDRTQIPEEVLHTFRATGTAHVLAISGFHVGVVAAGAAWWGRFGAGLWSLLFPRGAHGALALFPAWCCAAVYIGSAGAPVSGQRALGLLVLVGLARTLGRRVSPLPVLGVVAVGVLALDPAALATASFQLSFGAIVGLVLITPPLTRLVPPDLPRPVPFVLSGTIATAGATVGTLPAAAWWFQTLPPSSPVANLVALPWIAWGVVPFAAFATWLPEPVAKLFGWLGTRSLGGLLLTLGALETTPWRPAAGPAGAVALAALVFLPRWPWVALCGGLAGLALRTVPTVATATFLNVGQGDAALVQQADGTVVLIDGGPPGQALGGWLRRRGIRRIDVVVATHGQADHVGALSGVLEDFRVGALWAPSGDEGLAQLVATALARDIEVVHTGRGVLHPPLGLQFDNPNEHSMVLELERMLFTGDIESLGEAAVAGLLEQPMELLKVPHHGSRTSSSDGLLQAAAPTLAVASMGKDNRYGHPNQVVVDRYHGHHIPLYRTDRHGTVELVQGAHTLQLRGWRAGTGWSALGSYPRDRRRTNTAPKAKSQPRPGASPVPEQPPQPPSNHTTGSAGSR